MEFEDLLLTSPLKWGQSMHLPGQSETLISDGSKLLTRKEWNQTEKLPDGYCLVDSYPESMLVKTGTYWVNESRSEEKVLKLTNLGHLKRGRELARNFRTEIVNGQPSLRTHFVINGIVYHFVVMAVIRKRKNP